jgi:2-C-methyl-D-erythritol 4-phosphate cytidylyltransferase
VVVAAGSSTRTQALGPKLWLEIGGRPLIALTLEHIRASGECAGGVLVTRETDRLRGAALFRETVAVPEAWTTAVGGASRSQSVAAGLDRLADLGATDEDIVLIHDGARPLMPPAVVARVLEGVRQVGAALPVLAPTDTVKVINVETGSVDRTLPRHRLGLAQTPQGFRLGLALRAHRALAGYEPTDDAEAAERLGVAVAAVAGDERNRKITVPHDVHWLRWQLGPGAAR